MALDTAPLLTRRRVLAAKLEPTTGEAVALANADAVTPVFDPVMTFDIPAVERDPFGNSMSPVLQHVGRRGGTVGFGSELFNGSGGLPAWADWLRACGMTLITGGTFAPITGATETLTIGLYNDGRLKRMAGCMGTFTLTLTSGEKGRFRWTFSGVPQAPSATALLAPTFATAIAPRVGAATFEIGGQTYRVPSIEIEFGNEVIMREDVTAQDADSDPTGFRAAYITGRRPIVRVSAEALPLGTQDWYEVHRDLTTAALSLVVGAGANNTFTITAPKLQLVAAPTDGDREGMLTDELEFLCVRNGSGGDDELTIAFS